MVKRYTQPQGPAQVDPAFNLIAGYNPALGNVDITGKALTAGTGLTKVVNPYGIGLASVGTGGLTRSISGLTSAYPRTFVGIARHNSTGTRMLSSLATSADKTLRVFIDTGVVYAQHIGATTSASALVSASSYGTYFKVVAVFKSQTDVTIYVTGNVTRAKNQNTTDVGAVAAPTLVAYGAYNGSAITAYLDGELDFAAWLGIAATEAQAWSLLDNPWQIYASQKLVFPAAAVAGGVTATGVSGTAATGSVGPAISVPLTGVAGTTATGTLAVGSVTTIALTGVAAASATGSVTPALTAPITGVAATSALGAVAPSLAAPLTGVATTSATGAVGPALAAPITGVAATAALGAVGPTLTIPLTGVAGTTAAGTFTVGSVTTVALTGVGSTASAGTLATVLSIPVVGAGVAAQTGNLIVSGGTISVALSGLSASVLLGTLTPSQVAKWADINNAQAIVWQNTDTSQTAGWQNVADSQTPNWQTVLTSQ